MNMLLLNNAEGQEVEVYFTLARDGSADDVQCIVTPEGDVIDGFKIDPYQVQAWVAEANDR